MGTDGYYTYSGDHFVMYLNVESLCCKPETNIILYVNYYFNKRKRRAKIKSQIQKIVGVAIVMKPSLVTKACNSNVG